MGWKDLKVQKDTYDLCILDVMMPYKDGYILEIREKIMKFQLYFDSKINERRCAKRI
jgi:hypothetical protein